MKIACKSGDRIPSILKAPKQSFFLLGPRGTGKSTRLRETLPDAHTIDLSSEDKYQRLLANPGGLADELRALTSAKWVIVDEVQRLPGLLNEVHRFVEEKRVRFVLCGSSAGSRKALSGAFHSQRVPYSLADLNPSLHLKRQGFHHPPG